MRTIWKYPLEVTDEQKIRIPSSAILLSAQAQKSRPCLWALVDPTEPETDYIIATVKMHGTGQPVPNDVLQNQFLGTIQLWKGDLVFHVFVKFGGRV
jgi:hypothetical protein